MCSRGESRGVGAQRQSQQFHSALRKISCHFKAVGHNMFQGGMHVVQDSLSLSPRICELTRGASRLGFCSSFTRSNAQGGDSADRPSLPRRVHEITSSSPLTRSESQNRGRFPSSAALPLFVGSWRFVSLRRRASRVGHFWRRAAP